jgi:hypothetical protein
MCHRPIRAKDFLSAPPGTPAHHSGAAPGDAAPGDAAPGTSDSPRTAILTAFNGVSGDIFYSRVTASAAQATSSTLPKLSRLPSEIIRQQVYASFQHDKSAVQVVPATGYRNVLWGDDYPHLEGTYGHTQETLRGLFADASDEVRERITRGTFNELFRVPEQTPRHAAV